MWWIAPWLVFGVCVGGGTVSYLLWRRQPLERHPRSLGATADRELR